MSVVTVTVPGSKSLTIRAVFAAALADGLSTITGSLDADDTRRAIGAIQAFGATAEEHAGVWTVSGVDGRPVQAGAPIDVGESGLTSRITIATAALVNGQTTLVGSGRIADRPMGEILAVVSGLGAEVLDGEGIPCTIRGSGSIPGGVVKVDAARSTQFATALMLVAPFADDPMRIAVENLAGSGGYLDLTAEVLRAFGADFTSGPDGWSFQASHLKGTSFHVEPDASAAVYPLAAAAVTGNEVRIDGLGAASRQPDIAIVEAFESMGCEAAVDESSITLVGPDSGLRGIEMDVSGWPDGAMALAATCAVASSPSTLRGLHSLRYKESERLTAMADGLTGAGARVEVIGSDLHIVPGPLRPAEVRAHGDHRVAMSFGVLSLVERGIVVDDPGVVTKTWPGYWEEMERLSGSWDAARRGA